MPLPAKARVVEALRAELRAALEAMARSAESDREGATHAENRQEGSKDMRSTEQSYVARGKAMRAEELAEQLGRFEQASLRAYGDDDAIGPGALVRLSLEDEPDRVVLLAPVGGGTRLAVDGVAVVVVTPASPLGRGLLGRRVGDELILRARGADREHVVEELG